MQNPQANPTKSIEKQLNRIVVLLRNGPTPEEERKICSVFESLVSYSFLHNLAISVGVTERVCENCKGNFDDLNLKSFTFRCGHKLCSVDCLAQYLSKEQLCEQLSCARQTCEIKSPKAEFLQDEDVSMLTDYKIKCMMCESIFLVEGSIKLPCSHRFCAICILSFIRSQDFIDFKNGCPCCLFTIPKTISSKILNPNFEDEVRASLHLN